MNGRVTTTAGAQAGNVTVVITETATGATQRVLTAADGTFRIANLAPGTYRVEVEQNGVRRPAAQPITLTAGAPAEVTLSVAGGGGAETVEVQGQTPAIQDQSAEIARSYGTRTVRELPVIDRNYQELTGLMTGVTPPRPGFDIGIDPQRSRVWETNGLPYWANERRMDGAVNQEPVTTAAVHVHPAEGVRELNLATSTWEPRHGRSGGSNVNSAGRSGTNEFHGSAFYFFGHEKLRARNFFNPSPDPKPNYRNNQLGGSLGGPVKRDSLYFFANYQGDRLRAGETRYTTVPTAAMRAGDFSEIPGLTLYNPFTGTAAGANRVPFSNARIGAGALNPIAGRISNLLPLPNRPGFENNYVGNVPVENDGHRGTIRLDAMVTEDTNAFARFSHSNFYLTRPSLLGDDVGGGFDSHLISHNAAIGLTHNVNAGMQTTAILNFNHYRIGVNAMTAPSQITAAGLGFTGAAPGAAFPSIDIAGMDAIGLPANPRERNWSQGWNLLNNWSWQRGRHNITFGGDVWWYRADGWDRMQYGQQGGFTFGAGPTAAPGQALGGSAFANAYAAFLLGSPTQSGITTSRAVPSVMQWQTSGFIGDTIQLTQRLTVNAGVRYDFFTTPNLRRAGSAFQYNFAGNTLVPIGEDTRGNVQQDYNNFAPRLGIAFRATERTVVRGGYAMSYFNEPLGYQSQYLIPNTQTFQQGLAGGFTPSGGFNAVPQAGALAGSAAPNRQLAFTDPNRRTPFVHTYSLQVQHDLGRSTTFDVAYVGNLGRQLPFTREWNAAAPGTGVAGLPLNRLYGRTASTLELGNGVNSNYNSLQVNVTKRFTNGLAMTGAYTWSRAMDYGNGLQPFLNNIDISRNYGPADWDRRHMFSLSHVWQLPFGSGTNRWNTGAVGSILGNWQVNGILRWVTGAPLNVTVDPSVCNCPGNTALADVVQTGTETRFIQEPTWYGFWVAVPYRFPVFQFQQPAAGAFGNLGRNAIYGNRMFNYDLALFKSFPVSEQVKLEFRGEAYNLTNTPQFADPILNLNSFNFGQSRQTMVGRDQRTIHLALRVLF